MTEKQIAEAHALELVEMRGKIDRYLEPLAGIAIIDRHHRALIARVKEARDGMIRARDLQRAKECAENLFTAYTRPKGHKFAIRALEWLAECPDEPFPPTVDLEGRLSFL